MQSQTTVVRSTQVLVAFLTLFTMEAPAIAQTIGARAGVSVDPEQFYFGAHAETPPLVDRLRFRPNVEIGLGDDITIAAFNVEFAYHFRSTEAWNVYAGGGPALNVFKRGRETDAEPGVNALVGVAHEDGLFAEFKVGALDGPRVKFGVGYSVKW